MNIKNKYKNVEKIKLCRQENTDDYILEMAFSPTEIVYNY
jgi:hypothetical protein